MTDRCTAVLRHAHGVSRCEETEPHVHHRATCGTCQQAGEDVVLIWVSWMPEIAELPADPRCEHVETETSGPCGAVATARVTDDATDEVHYGCDEHAYVAAGHYDVTPLRAPEPVEPAF